MLLPQKLLQKVRLHYKVKFPKNLLKRQAAHCLKPLMISDMTLIKIWSASRKLKTQSYLPMII